MPVPRNSPYCLSYALPDVAGSIHFLSITKSEKLKMIGEGRVLRARGAAWLARSADILSDGNRKVRGSNPRGPTTGKNMK